MVNRSLISVKHETRSLLQECKQEFLKHHPEFENIPLSFDKIIYEAAKFYLKEI